MEIINRLKQYFRPAAQGMTLADILSTEASKEELLGMKAPLSPTTEQIIQDANRLINYSHSADYRVWAKEAWSKVLSHIDAVQSSKSTTDEVNFHRGALKATLDLLRVSYQARAVRDSLEAQENVSTAR